MMRRDEKTIGEAYLGLGLYRAAEPHLEEAVQIRRRVLGDDHPSTVRAMNDLARLRVFQGRLPEAERICRDAVGIAQRARMGSQRMRMQRTYGALLILIGRQEEGEAQLREALGRAGEPGTIPPDAPPEARGDRTRSGQPVGGST